METILNLISFILAPTFGLISIILGISVLLRDYIRNAEYSLISLNLSLLFCLPTYITYKDSQSLIDVGDVFKRCGIILIILVLIILLLNKERTSIINKIKIYGLSSVVLLFYQYVISYFMMTEGSQYILANPYWLVIIANILTIRFIQCEFKKK